MPYRALVSMPERGVYRVGAHAVVAEAELAEHRTAEDVRPAGHGVLAADEDVAGEVAGRHRILQQRRLHPVRVLEAVADKHLVARPEVVVGADVELVDVALQDAVGDEVVVEEARAGHVWQRIEVDELGRHRADARGVDGLGGGVHAPGRHEGVGGRHRAGELAQVAGPHPRGRHGRCLRQGRSVRVAW
jgi:hypothetical protein